MKGPLACLKSSRQINAWTSQISHKISKKNPGHSPGLFKLTRN